MTRVITIATPEILPACRGIIDNQKGYASALGFEHSLVESVYWDHMPASFSKVWEIGKAMKEGCDFVIWADADVIFTNWKIDLTRLLEPDFMLAAYHQRNWKSWVYLCAGLQVWRNTPAARDFVDIWSNRCLTGFMKDHPWDQWFLDEMVRETSYRGIRPCDAKEIGCFSPEIWHDGVIWKPGMPTVHMAGPATWERRAEVYDKVYKKQVIK